MLADNPGIVNRTFENRTQSNSIHRLGSIELGNPTKSNNEFCVSSISEPIELIEQIEPNRTQSIRLCCIEFGNRTQSTQLNGLLSIDPGKPIQSKPHQSRDFLCFLPFIQ